MPCLTPVESTTDDKDLHSHFMFNLFNVKRCFGMASDGWLAV